MHAWYLRARNTRSAAHWSGRKLHALFCWVYFCVLFYFSLCRSRAALQLDMCAFIIMMMIITVIAFAFTFAIWLLFLKLGGFIHSEFTVEIAKWKRRYVKMGNRFSPWMCVCVSVFVFFFTFIISRATMNRWWSGLLYLWNRSIYNLPTDFPSTVNHYLNSFCPDLILCFDLYVCGRTAYTCQHSCMNHVIAFTSGRFGWFSDCYFN